MPRRKVKRGEYRTKPWAQTPLGAAVGAILADRADVLAAGARNLGELAAVLGVAQSYLSKALAGQVAAGAKVSAEAIAAVLGVEGLPAHERRPA